MAKVTNLKTGHSMTTDNEYVLDTLKKDPETYLIEEEVVVKKTRPSKKAE